MFLGKIYEKLCLFREGQFVPWFTKLEDFNDQIVAIKNKRSQLGDGLGLNMSSKERAGESKEIITE